MRTTFAILACFILALGASGQSSKKVSEAKKKLNSVQSNRKNLVNKLQGTKTEKHNISLQIQKVDGWLGQIGGALEDTQDQLASSKVKQKEIVAELNKAEGRLDTVREQVKSRVRAIQRQGSDSVYLSLLGSRNIATLASRKSILEKIATRDRALFDEAKILKQRVAERKSEQDKVVSTIAKLEGKQRGEQNRLREAMAEKKTILTDLKGDIAAIERQLDELDRQSAVLENQIAAYQNASRRGTSGYVSPYKGKLLMPTVGRHSSPFGMRTHPISRKKRMHNGMDIAAKTGTAIKAAAPGVVITAGWMSGYGNTVVIDHGGSMSTLYGHCSRIHVKKGARVSRGQKIASVGSTGNSTGPHLHFEVRIKGRPVNPRGYL